MVLLFSLAYWKTKKTLSSRNQQQFQQRRQQQHSTAGMLLEAGDKIEAALMIVMQGNLGASQIELQVRVCPISPFRFCCLPSLKVTPPPLG